MARLCGNPDYSIFVEREADKWVLVIGSIGITSEFVRVTMARRHRSDHHGESEVGGSSHKSAANPAKHHWTIHVDMLERDDDLVARYRFDDAAPRPSVTAFRKPWKAYLDPPPAGRVTRADDNGRRDPAY